MIVGVAWMLLLAFLMQNLHFVDLWTPVKPYMAVAPVAFVLCAIQRRGMIGVRAAEYMSLIFFGLMVITATWADDPAIALYKVAGIAVLIVAYYTVRTTFGALTKEQFFRMLTVCGVITFIASLGAYVAGFIALGDYVPAQDFDPDADRGYYGLYLEGPMIRMRGVYENPNSMALICVFFFLYFDFVKGRLATLGKVLVVLCLALTLSATGIGVLTVVYVMGSLLRGRYMSIAALFGSVALIAVLIYAIVPPEVLAPALDQRASRLASGSGRDQLWEYSLGKAMDRPILGYGLNQSKVILKARDGYQSTHNSTIEAMVDGGLVAVFVYLLCWISVFSYAFSLSWRSRQPFYAAAMVSLFVFSQSNVLTFLELSVMVFALWFEIARRADRVTAAESPAPALT
jgi:O-antigen ligase